MSKNSIGINDSESHISRKKRMSRKKRKRQLIISLIVLIIIFFAVILVRAKMQQKKMQKENSEIGTVESINAEKKKVDDDGNVIEKKNPINIYAFNVGDKNAILIDDGSFEVLLDGGCDGKKLVKNVSSYIDGDLEYVVNTNYINDSTAGLKDIYSNFKVEKTIIANTPQNTAYDKKYDCFFNFLKAAKKKSGIGTINIINDTQTINLSNGASLTIEPNCNTSSDVLNQSALCYLSYEGNEVWFMGSAGKELFQTLKESERAGNNISVLFAPRNGSMDALDIGTINTISPDNIVIQGTNPKKHGQLTTKGLSKYVNICQSVYVTYKGTVVVTLGGTETDVSINEKTSVG